MLKILALAVLTCLMSLAALASTPQATFRQVLSSTAVATSAYTTVFASLTRSASSVLLYSSSNQTLVLSWAMSCAGLASTAHSVLLGPGVSGTTDFAAPPTACVGIKAISGTANTGELDVTIF